MDHRVLEEDHSRSPVRLPVRPLCLPEVSPVPLHTLDSEGVCSEVNLCTYTSGPL